MRPLAGCLLVACAGSPCRAWWDGPPAGWIVHVAEPDGRAALWRVRADGTDAAPWLAGPGARYPGDVGPDGRMAVIAVAPDGGGSLHVAHAPDGPLGAPIATATRFDPPRWQGDGLVFGSDATSFGDVYRWTPTGGLTQLTEAPHGSFEPTPGPDGAIAFASSRDGNAELYVQRGSVTRLTHHPADDTRPRWRPGGEVLAFLSNRGGTRRAWRVGVDGGTPQPIVGDGDGEHLDLVWSPDGTRLALVVRTGQGRVALHVVDGDTGALRARFAHDGVDEHPAWSPDGRWLAWTRSTQGDSDVWVARADGTAARPVADGPATQWLPRWVTP